MDIIDIRESTALVIYKRKVRSLISQQLLTLCKVRFTNAYYTDGLSLQTNQIMAFFEENAERLETIDKEVKEQDKDIEELKQIIRDYRDLNYKIRVLQENDEGEKVEKDIIKPEIKELLDEEIGENYNVESPETWRKIRKNANSQFLPEEYDALLTLISAWDIGIDLIENPVILHTATPGLQQNQNSNTVYKYLTLKALVRSGAIELDGFIFHDKLNDMIREMQAHDRKWYDQIQKILSKLKKRTYFVNEFDNDDKIMKEKINKELLERAKEYAENFKMTLSPSFLAELRMLKDQVIAPFFLSKKKKVPETIIRRLIFQDPIGLGSLLLLYNESKKFRKPQNFYQNVNKLVYAPTHSRRS